MLNKQIDSLSRHDKELRFAADLEPISDEEKKLGIGGGSFDNSLDFLNDESSFKLKKALSFVDEVARKIKFEKAQYNEIGNKLSENKKLFACYAGYKAMYRNRWDAWIWYEIASYSWHKKNA